MKNKTLYIILAFSLFVIVVIMGKKLGWFGSKTDGKVVKTEKVIISTLTEKVSAVGKIHPELEVKISSEVSGEIIELPVSEGQSVKKGDILVRINPDIYQSAVNRSEASLENAKASLRQAEASLKEIQQNYKRHKILFEKGIISKAEWEKIVSSHEIALSNSEAAKYNVLSATATVAEAYDNLKRTTIYSPANGTISKLNVEIGERVVGAMQMTGTEIMRVANLRSMEVEVDVNENDIVKVNIGNKANIEVDAYPKKIFEGTVSNISNTANNTSNVDQVTNFKVKIHIEESSYADLLEGKKTNHSPFLPGMTATADIITLTKENILIIPISAVVMKSATDFSQEVKTTNEEEAIESVFVKINGKAQLRAVNTGIQDNTSIEITSGLNFDEEVIVGPYNLVSRVLKNGDKVVNDNNEENDKE